MEREKIEIKGEKEVTRVGRLIYLWKKEALQKREVLKN